MYIRSYIMCEGISNEMLLGQPTTEAVMLKLQSFVGNRPIIGAKLNFPFMYAIFLRLCLYTMHPCMQCSDV